MIIVNVLSASFDSVKRLVVKFIRYGLNDTQTAIDVAPYGTDANPIAGMIALYDVTPGSGETFIVGYLVKNRMAAPGEHRIFSTDSNGNLKAYLWAKNNGNLELNGNADNAVRYAPLNTELSSFKTVMQAELVKIATGIIAGGGTYTPGTLSLDISASKIDTVLTP